MKVRIKGVAFREGFRVPKGAKAGEVRREIARIYQRHGGGATAREVFEDVQANKKSPLRGFFCWDKTAGWLQWNYQLARVLQGGLVVTIARSDDEGDDIVAPGAIAMSRSTASAKGEQDDDECRSKVYKLVEDVMGDEALRGQALRQALAEFHAWRRRWETFKELAAIFKAASKVKVAA